MTVPVSVEAAHNRAAERLLEVRGSIRAAFNELDTGVTFDDLIVYIERDFHIKAAQGAANDLDRLHAASEHVSIVRLEAAPLPPKRGKIDVHQRERQAWRGLSWYLESNLKAATFGLIPFEAIFLAHFEGVGGKTIGQSVIPKLEQGQLALPAGD